MILYNGEKINIEKFPNNELRLRNIEFVDNALIEFKYESSDDIIALVFLKRSIDEKGFNSSLYIRYMPYSRMDREFENDLFLLKYMAGIINSLNFKMVYVLEPHSKATLDLLDNITPIYPMKELIELVKKEIAFSDRDHIVFPDSGSFERYYDDDYKNYISFKKKRDEDSTKIKELYLDTGEVNEKSKCIIVDDLCSTGTTCLKVSKILKERGAKEVYVLVVHTENQALLKDIVKDESTVDTIFTTDSLITEENPKVKILHFDPKKNFKEDL